MTQNRINQRHVIIQKATNSISTVVTCSGTIPLDNTIPQSTEGTQVLTCTIKPIYSFTQLLIEFSGPVCSDLATRDITVALFQDSTANALMALYFRNQSCATTAILRHLMTSGTTNSTTFKIRIGPTSPTVYVNGNSSGSQLMGGVSMTRLTITEIL